MDRIDMLNPEVKSLLKNLAVNDAFSGDNINVLRDNYAKLESTLGFDFESLAQVKDKNIQTDNGTVNCRLYHPEINKELPLIIYVHGGGWLIGNLDSHDLLCRKIAKDSRCIVLAIDYKLAPEYPAPSGPDDVLGVIKQIPTFSADEGINLNKISIMGDSAGGSLAAMAALNFRNSNIKIRSQVLFYPSTDVSLESRRYLSREENKNFPPLTLDAMNRCIELFTGNFNRKDIRLSPLLSQDHKNLPPTLIFTGEMDTLRDDGKLYAQALENSGVQVEYHEIKGMIHGFIEMTKALPSIVWTFDRSIEFILSNYDD